MVLSDRTIKEELAKGRIKIEPLDEDYIQPASVDLRLDRQILDFHPERYSYLDILEDLSDLTELVEIPDPAPYILKPDQFILASTLEHVELPDDIVARLEGKSSLGRLGLLIHSTAGYIDPGWKGQLTLEISNVAGVDITLYYGMKISQISFLRLSTPADRPYGSQELRSKYQGQIGPTRTRSHMEFVPTRGIWRRTGGDGRRRPYPTEPTELKRWLDTSPYEGSVTRFATVLQLQLKTVEDWVYGRSEPSLANKTKLFDLTRLPRYAPEPTPEQAELFGGDQNSLI